MKRFIGLTVLTVVLLAGAAAFVGGVRPAAAASQEVQAGMPAPQSARTISVTGTVETQMAPDMIVWNVSLRDMDKNFVMVKNVSDDRIKKVVALREKLGIAEGDFQMGTLSVERVYEPSQPGIAMAAGDNRGTFKGYAMRRNVTIIQRDLKQFDQYFDALLGSAEMEASYRYDSSHKYDVRKETRLKALKAAREKADAMAQALGAKVGRVMTVDENSGDRGMGYSVNNNSYSDARPPAVVDAATERFVPGSMTERVSVNVTFELN